MIKRILLILSMTLMASNATAQIIKVTVNGIYASDVTSSSYAEPDTSIFYTFMFDTADTLFADDTQIFINPVTITYQLGTLGIVTFDSIVAFTSGVWGVLDAPISATSIDQLNINTAFPPFLGAASNLNFNFGVFDFDGGFYSASRFSGQYEITTVPAPTTLMLFLLSAGALLVSRRNTAQ